MKASPTQVYCQEAQGLPQEVFCSNQPLLLKGLVSSWPAVEASTSSNADLADYLRGFATDVPVTVFQVPQRFNGRVFYNQDLTDFNFTRTRRSLSSVLDSLLDAKIDQDLDHALYVGSTMVDHWLPGFRTANDIDLDGRDSLVSIWLGGRVRIAAHYDFPHNIACNISGRRRFTLFAPEQAENLYVGPIDFTPAGQAISLVDFEDPDLERFPRFATALNNALQVELEPGDALFIPSMWWHHVESLEQMNTLVNYWWRPTPTFHGSPNNALLHAILAIKDLPKEQRESWRRIFDDYVFEDNGTRFDHIPEAARGVLNGVNEETAAQIKNQLLKFMK